MLILIRHGEAAHHTENLTGGWTDSELTERGKKQIQAAADFLARDFAGQKDVKLRVLASDLQRASLSAELIAQTLNAGLKVERHAFLREKNNGLAAGLTESAAKAIYTPAPNPQALHHRNYPGGETRSEFYKRTVEGLLACADPEKENLLIVAHKGTIQNIVFYWLGMSMEEAAAKKISVDIAPASVTVLGVNKWGERAVFRLNDVAHLGEGRCGVFNFKYGGAR